MNRLKQYLLQLPVPATWDQLATPQYVQVASGPYLYTGTELRARITWALLGISWRTPRRVAAILFGLSPLDRHQLTKLAEPFLEPEGLLHTPLKALSAGRTTLPCAHADLLNELDTEEWGLADTLFLRFAKTKDPELLRAMACVLYAPEGTTREERLKGKHLPLMASVPTEQLLAMHHQWTAHRLRLKTDAPWVFRSVNEKTATRRKSGWTDVMLSMAGTKFGPYNEVARTKARVFLRELSHQIEEATRLKNERESAKNRSRR